MKLSSVVATTVAGVWLAGACAGAAHGGWFGLGDSNTSSNTSKTSKSQSSTFSKTSIGTAKTASSSGKSTSGGIAGLFGLGKQSTNKQSTNKISNPYKSKAKKDDKSGTSWWNSLFKPKETPPPKSTGEWMKLKQVKY